MWPFSRRTHQLPQTEPRERLFLSPWLLKVIAADDAARLEAALSAMLPAARAHFLTGSEGSTMSGLFRHQVDSWARLEEGDARGHVIDVSVHRDWACDCQLYKPWLLAAVYGSHNVLKVMLRHGVHVLQKDQGGYNVIHSLVLVSHLRAAGELRANGTLVFLKAALGRDVFRTLLLDEDVSGLRPLELAAHFGTFLLFSTIFETRGLYLVKERTTGIYTTQWFDVTEYETSGPGGRQGKSPLLTFTLLDKSRVFCPHLKRMLLTLPTGTVLRKWFQAKLRVNRPLIFLWFVARMVYLLVFFSAMSLGEGLLDGAHNRSVTSRNATNRTLRPRLTSEAGGGVPPVVVYAAFCYLLLHSLASCLLDAVELYVVRRGSLAWILRTQLGDKTPALHYASYRCAQFALTASVITCTLLIAALQGDVVSIPRVVDHLFLIQAMCCVVVSVMFFLQATACMGPFIISFERMIKHLACFMTVFFFFTIPFSVVFRHITCDDGGDALCAARFSTWADSLYSVFTITLNMINFADFQVRYRLELFLMHVQYVFVIIMLLLNFLVAHFTRSVSRIMDNAHVLMPIQRLSIAWSMELRLNRLLPALYRKLRARNFTTVGERLLIARTCVVGSRKTEEEEGGETEPAEEKYEESSESGSYEGETPFTKPVISFPL